MIQVVSQLEECTTVIRVSAYSIVVEHETRSNGMMMGYDV